MSAPDSTALGVWPWGKNAPTPGARLAVAATIASLVLVAFVVIHFPRLDLTESTVRMHSDFSPSWYGAKLLRDGLDPYQLIGPGRSIEYWWPPYYPATAYVLLIPFTLLPEQVASLVFVFASSFLLVFGATRESWHRLPMFASVPFLTATILAQWSMLMTAVIFLPWLAFVVCAKPQAGLPALVGSKRRLLIAVGGGIPILLVSMWLLPSWPKEWLGLIAASGAHRAPVRNFGGFLILLVLLRWRRPDTWLILAMALVPQAWFPYNWLMLLVLPETYREACVLTLVASVGALAGEYAVYGMHPLEAARVGGAFSVAFAYLPATLLVLRRPNVGRRTNEQHFFFS